MTIVQVLAQHVERVNKLESEMKEKEELSQKAETKAKKKAAEEAKLVEELKSIKRLLTQAHQHLEAKNNALNAEIKKGKASEVSTLTV